MLLDVLESLGLTIREAMLLNNDIPANGSFAKRPYLGKLSAQTHL
jgi:hypothetical protein